MRKIAVDVGDALGAARAADYLVEEIDAPSSFGRGDYWVTPELEGEGLNGNPARANTMWLGSDDALAAFGLTRGTEVTSEALSTVLQGKHVQDVEEQVRRPGWITEEALDADGNPVLDAAGVAVKVKRGRVISIDMTYSVPKSLSVLWSAASPELRAEIERIVMDAANTAMEYMIQTKRVVNWGRGRRDYATGGVWSQTLHVTARRAEGEEVPSPQLHVHAVLAGVMRSDGELVAPDSWELFRADAPLEGAAVFRAAVADGVRRMGFGVEAETGKKDRFFEVAGVSQDLMKDMSGRTRDVEREIARRELLTGMRLTGAGLSIVAHDTRAPKDKDVSGERVLEVWREQHAARGFGADSAVALMREGEPEQPLETRRERWRVAYFRSMRAVGPTVSAGMARALAFQLAPHGASVWEVNAWINELERSGELLALEGGVATLGEIRSAEQHVMRVAQAAANAGAPALSKAAVEHGLAVADARLGAGKALDDEQREAVRKLTSGAGWTTLTGRAGTGKGPTLDAVAAAYQADGWRVIAAGAEGELAARMSKQVGDDAHTLETVVRRVASGSMRVDSRTLLVIDEATKVSLRYWTDIADWVERHGVRVVAIGHDGQLDAIELPGMFGQMLRPRFGIPGSDLSVIRRHRDAYTGEEHKWLTGYQVEVDKGNEIEHARRAVEILVENDALTLYDGREAAMVGLVQHWDGWRHKIGEHEITPEESLLLVHGSNADVDFINQLAQAVRYSAGELSVESVQATDRDYRLHVGDVVVLRNAPYVLDAGAGGSERVVNGQSGIVVGLDEEKRHLTVQMTRPDGSLRLATFDLAAMEAAGSGAAAWRLRYASHTYPAQGVTVRGTAALSGHWSQSKEATYVADTRSVFVHSVHIAREDLGLEGTDADRLERYARQISQSKKRKASIDRELDPEAQVSPRGWTHEAMPELPLRGSGRATEAEVEAEAARATGYEPGAVGMVPTRPAVADPLEPWRKILGERRANALADRADALDEVMQQRAHESLLMRRATLGTPLELIDRATARKQLTVERDRAIAQRQVTESTAEAERLTEKAEGLTGRRQRKQRQEALDGAAQHQHMAGMGQEALKDLVEAERRLRGEGRDLESWASEHVESAAEWLAVERELAVRRQRALLEAVERAAIDPPAHVREAIGAAPETNAPERAEWERLARAIERGHASDELHMREGLKPPRRDPLERQRLDERIERLRTQRGLDGFTPPVVERPAPPRDYGR